MDDTYIHMAIAKNFAVRGVWGVTQYEFSSSTSSPLYSALLAASYKLTGVHDITPLVLNVVAAFALIAFAAYMLRKAGLTTAASVACLVSLVILMPLPAVAEGGMEHTLHALLTLLFLHLASRSLSGGGDSIWVAPLGAALVMTRYESAFLIFGACVLYLIRRRIGPAVRLAFAGTIPLVLYGWVCVQKGWFILPNSVLLKANVPKSGVGGGVVEALSPFFDAGKRAPHIVFLILSGLLLLITRIRQRRNVWDYPTVGLVLFVWTATLHLLFARTGWFYRYEAYLVAAGIVTFAVAAFQTPRPRFNGVFRAAYACAIISVALLGVKSARSLIYGPRAFHNIYDQQYQMARFLQRFFPQKTVVLNDIGAVCFYTDLRVLDVYGLGSMEPARAKLRHTYNTAWLRQWAGDNRADLAIVYSTGWAGDSFAIPKEWDRIASWVLSDNFVLAGNTVDLYAIKPTVSALIARDVQEFRSELPPEIVQHASFAVK